MVPSQLTSISEEKAEFCCALIPMLDGAETAALPHHGCGQKRYHLALSLYPDHSLDKLTFASCPPAGFFRPRSPSTLLRGSYHQCFMRIQPVLLPVHRREVFVREVRVVIVGSYQEFAYGALIGVGLGQPEGENNTLRANREGDLETVDPLGFGGTSAESRLAGE